MLEEERSESVKNMLGNMYCRVDCRVVFGETVEKDDILRNASLPTKAAPDESDTSAKRSKTEMRNLDVIILCFQ